MEPSVRTTLMSLSSHIKEVGAQLNSDGIDVEALRTMRETLRQDLYALDICIYMFEYQNER